MWLCKGNVIVALRPDEQQRATGKSNHVARLAKVTQSGERIEVVGVVAGDRSARVAPCATHNTNVAIGRRRRTDFMVYRVSVPTESSYSE